MKDLSLLKNETPKEKGFDQEQRRGREKEGENPSTSKEHEIAAQDMNKSTHKRAKSLQWHFATFPPFIHPLSHKNLA